MDAENFTDILDASKWVMFDTPDLPDSKEDQSSFTLFPRGVIHPSPVTTTLLFAIIKII